MAAPSSKTPKPPLFSIKRIKQSRPSTLRFVKLVKNGNCQFDDFLQQIEDEGGYDKEVDKAIRFMDHLAQRKHLTGDKHHDYGTHACSVKGKVYEVRLFEIKTKNLRIYYFHQSPYDEIVVLMGKKNTQAASESAFKSLVDQYLIFRYS